MTFLGWCLVLLTLLYPWEAVYTWYQLRDLLASEAAAAPQGSGMVFNLKTSVIHCGLVSWLGGVGTFLSLVWLLVAFVAWVGRRIRHEPALGASSRMVVAAVVGAVV